MLLQAVSPQSAFPLFQWHILPIYDINTVYLQKQEHSSNNYLQQEYSINLYMSTIYGLTGNTIGENLLI